MKPSIQKAIHGVGDKFSHNINLSPLRVRKNENNDRRERVTTHLFPYSSNYHKN